MGKKVGDNIVSKALCSNIIVGSEMSFAGGPDALVPFPFRLAFGFMPLPFECG
jgi:hypothetical protein